MRVRIVLCVVLLGLCGIPLAARNVVPHGLPSVGQEWMLQKIGDETPLETAARVARSPANPLSFFINVFTITEGQGGENKLNHTRYNVEQPSLALTVRLPTTSGVLFGLSKDIVSVNDETLAAAYIDDGIPTALLSTNGGQTWTSTPVASERVYTETQIGMTPQGAILLAYHAVLRRIMIYRLQQTLVWALVGQLSPVDVRGAIYDGLRIALDSDERKEDLLVIYATGALLMYAQSFSTSNLAPIGSPVRIPVQLDANRITEQQAARMGDYVVGLTVSAGRHCLYSFNYKLSNPTVRLSDLGVAAAGIGTVAVYENGYIARRAPTFIDVCHLTFDSAGNVQFRPLPSIQAIANPNASAAPLSLIAGGGGDTMRLRLFYGGSLNVATFNGCVNSRRRLCNTGHRFEVTVDWRDQQGNTGSGRAVPLTGDTGYFWFFGSSNIEMVIKVLNGCGVNQRYWVFAGGLTNVDVEVTVHDTQTGATRTYHNPLNTPFQPIQDTSAFAGCSAGAKIASADLQGQFAAIEEILELPGDLSVLLQQSISPQQQSGSCSPSQTALCLNGNRFRVEASWRTSTGSTGSGRAVRLTDDSGYFWFFNAENVELITKVLNACSFSSRQWVFAGGLTDVQVEMTVTDTQSGAVKRYTNAQGTAFRPIQDTNAFSSCP